MPLDGLHIRNVITKQLLEFFIEPSGASPSRAAAILEAAERHALQHGREALLLTEYWEEDAPQLEWRLDTFRELLEWRSSSLAEWRQLLRMETIVLELASAPGGSLADAWYVSPCHLNHRLSALWEQPGAAGKEQEWRHLQAHFHEMGWELFKRCHSGGKPTSPKGPLGCLYIFDIGEYRLPLERALMAARIPYAILRGEYELAQILYPLALEGCVQDICTQKRFRNACRGNSRKLDREAALRVWAANPEAASVFETRLAQTQNRDRNSFIWIFPAPADPGALAEEDLPAQPEPPPGGREAAS